ncbi:pyrimidine 5'-nucleotidase [Pyruvatibacter sp. HU-CL02332]
MEMAGIRPLQLPIRGHRPTFRSMTDSLENAARKPIRHPQFDHVDTWIFDLDNTLYPAHCNLFAQIDERMGSFIANELDVDRVEARRIQKKFYVEHGTTLAGLMSEHGMAPGPFLDYVHDIDLAVVDPSEALDAALARLPGKRFIFTNGSHRHAENVAGKLGVLDRFDGIIDIAACNFVPKPHPDAFTHFLGHSRADAGRAAMFEDIARNLEVPHQLGMRTVWIQTHEDWATEKAHHGKDGEHVHHVTDDLVGFLDTL